MREKRRIGRIARLLAGLVLLTAACSHESSTSSPENMVVPRQGLIGAAVSNQSATLDIVGVRTGIPMTVNGDGSVSASVSQVPVGTWTFRITYYGGTPSVRILEASGEGTVQANVTISVSLNTRNSSFDEDGDGVSNLLEVNAGTNPLDPASFAFVPTAIAAGGSHSLLLKNNGRVLAWGANDFGQLGFGGIIGLGGPHQPIPVEVPGLTSVVAVAAGGNHSLALKSDGTLWAWGSNTVWQLGIGQTGHTYPFPRRVGSLTGVVGAAAAHAHSLAVKNDGTVWAWGTELNGELGNGGRSDDEFASPVQVVGPGGSGFLTDVASVAAGPGRSVALKSDGTVWEWGRGRSTPAQIVGPEGNGFLTDVVAISAKGDGLAVRRDGTVWRLVGIPIQVVGPAGTGFLTDIVAVAGGTSHSMAMKNDGTVWVWGSDSSGQLGNGGDIVSDQPTPILVTGPAGVLAVAAGGNHCLALSNNGTVWAWGADGSGQLGDDSALVLQPSPALVSGLVGADIVAAGGGHSLALNNNGTLWAWGSDSNGQLGNDATLAGQTRPVRVASLVGIVTVAAGESHSIAAKSDGTVWAWGRNSAGQLGNGAVIGNQALPAQVLGSGGSPFTDVTSVAAGQVHSLAVKKDGTVWAWGSDNDGQLGNGVTAGDQVRPVQVVGLNGAGFLTDVVSVVAGYSHSMALKQDGTVWAWGMGSSGQLGNGAATASQITPVQVVGLGGVVSIAAGRYHSVAFRQDGTVWAWGNADYGRVGNGTMIGNYLTPVQLSVFGGFGGAAATSIAAAEFHTIAARSDGTVWAWGGDSTGQLGNGPSVTENQSAPSQVVGPGGSGFLADVKKVAVGQSHSLAVKTDGTIWAWGSDTNQQLGNGGAVNSLQHSPVAVDMSNMSQ